MKQIEFYSTNWTAPIGAKLNRCHVNDRIFQFLQIKPQNKPKNKRFNKKRTLT